MLLHRAPQTKNETRDGCEFTLYRFTPASHRHHWPGLASLASPVTLTCPTKKRDPAVYEPFLWSKGDGLLSLSSAAPAPPPLVTLPPPSPSCPPPPPGLCQYYFNGTRSPYFSVGRWTLNGAVVLASWSGFQESFCQSSVWLSVFPSE